MLVLGMCAGLRAFWGVGCGKVLCCRGVWGGLCVFDSGLSGFCLRVSLFFFFGV